MKEAFPGVFRQDRNLYANDLLSGKLRSWQPEKSKLAAAILNGLKEMPIRSGSIVLYLGASTGTTVSHVSDIVGKDGFVYAIEFSSRMFQPLLELAKQRKNIAAIFADARKPEQYAWTEQCDVVYVDIAQPDQTSIAVRNADAFLKRNGTMFIAVKSQSIDVVKSPQQVYKEEKSKLEKAGFDILQLIDLEPYEEKHCMIVGKK